MSIQIHTFPQGQQLSDGELVQVQVAQSGRLVFKDAYFHELQDGDKYIIPDQVEMPLASDTEILDFIIRGKVKWIISDESWCDGVLVFDAKDIANDLANVHVPSTAFTHENLRGAFREAMTETINNQEL
jgi:hypothetical protein